MKLHSHKFVHYFKDGNWCILKISKSNVVNLRWKKRPTIKNVDEYRSWRTKVIQILYPGKRVLVVE